MPLISKSTYYPRLIHRNGHLSTIYMGALKPVSAPDYQRYRLILPDQDFLLIDYQIKSKRKAVILCHGLEGSSTSSYNNRAARYFLKFGYSVFAWNNRSCGGEMNPGIRLYHHGETEDLARVIDFVIQRGFEEIHLLGYSMGGAQIMNYLGRYSVKKQVRSAVAVSAPVSLKSSVQRMEKGVSRMYLKRFIKKIRLKVGEKARRYPGILDLSKVEQITSFKDLAKTFMLPVYGFRNLQDFYDKASPDTGLSQIKTPVLVLNAWDDPIIGAESYPTKTAQAHPFLYLETPDHGGHCGFPLKSVFYSHAEYRAKYFFENML